MGEWSSNELADIINRTIINLQNIRHVKVMPVRPETEVIIFDTVPQGRVEHFTTPVLPEIAHGRIS